MSFDAITSVDAHAAGAVLRLVTGGLGRAPGRTLALKARWLDRHHEAEFLALLREPRGRDGLTLGLLCEPDSDADAAVLFRRLHGFVPLPGSALVALATIAIERALVAPRRPGELRVETGLGTIDTTISMAATGNTARVERVRYSLPEAFVLAGGVPVAVGGRSVPVDVAWGGPFFVIVDSEAAGVPLATMTLPALRKMARAIAADVSRTLTLAHPTLGDHDGLGAVVFTGPPERPDAHIRGIAIAPDGFADRAPSGGALAATLAVLDAMGLATDDAFVVEGLAGTTLTGRIAGRTRVSEVPAVRVEIDGSAWIIGEHTWRLDPDDPLRTGFDW
jgi:proline racemase